MGGEGRGGELPADGDCTQLFPLSVHALLSQLPFLLPCSSLYPNVDFYSGIVLRALGIPVEMYTVLFAMARTVGWVAQVGKGVRGWNEGCSGVCRAGMLCRLILAVVLRCCCCSGPLLA